MDIPSYQSNGHATQEDHQEFQQEIGVRLEHGGGFFGEAEPFEGVGAGECVSHFLIVVVLYERLCG